MTKKNANRPSPSSLSFFFDVVNICYSRSLPCIDAVSVVCGCMSRENENKEKKAE